MDYLTKEERLKLHAIREDYLFILTDNVKLRDEQPELYHAVVDQWEAVKLKLEEDEHERIMNKCTTHILNEDGTITSKHDL
jgi:hypothetical protein